MRPERVLKTSTGFSNAGATHDDIKLFKKYVSPSVKIKAAGGIHTLEDAAEFAFGREPTGSVRVQSSE